MPRQWIAEVENLESRTFLSATAVAHAAPAARHESAIHASARVKHKRHTAATPTSILPSSGSFSYTYGGYTFSGTIDATTDALNATLVGPGVDFTVTGTFDSTAQTANLHVTGSNTDLTVVGSLSGHTITGSINGTVYGFNVSINNATFTV